MDTEIDFTIDQEDLQILYLLIRYSYKRMSFDKWVIEVKNVYKEYHDRNLNNLEKYGTPITFSRWVNGQIIGLTLILKIKKNMELKFYNRPFEETYSRVYDAKNNFSFQFENRFDDKGKHIESQIELQKQVIFSLNALDNEPIDGLNLSIDAKNETLILNNGLPFILIRGWGNLTGIGGYNFDVQKASKIQDDLRDWIIYKLTKK